MCQILVVHCDSVAVIGGRTLQILNAKQEDAGRYTCVATNEAGETLKHYEVKVYGETPSSLGACCIYLYYKRKQSPA